MTRVFHWNFNKTHPITTTLKSWCFTVYRTRPQRTGQPSGLHTEEKSRTCSSGDGQTSAFSENHEVRQSLQSSLLKICPGQLGERVALWLWWRRTPRATPEGFGGLIMTTGCSIYGNQWRHRGRSFSLDWASVETKRADLDCTKRSSVCSSLLWGPLKETLMLMLIPC